ncbi:MAG: hypothetical protein N2654_04965 [Deltaproteobacteria bacterium]|nr:hypothetical protein [Deltaproteobacteria bacterium]
MSPLFPEPDRAGIEEFISKARRDSEVLLQKFDYSHLPLSVEVLLTKPTDREQRSMIIILSEPEKPPPEGCKFSFETFFNIIKSNFFKAREALKSAIELGIFSDFEIKEGVYNGHKTVLLITELPRDIINWLDYRASVSDKSLRQLAVEKRARELKGEDVPSFLRLYFNTDFTEIFNISEEFWRVQRELAQICTFVGSVCGDYRIPLLPITYSCWVTTPKSYAPAVVFNPWFSIFLGVVYTKGRRPSKGECFTLFKEGFLRHILRAPTATQHSRYYIKDENVPLMFRSLVSGLLYGHISNFYELLKYLNEIAKSQPSDFFPANLREKVQSAYEAGGLDTLTSVNQSIETKQQLGELLEKSMDKTTRKATYIDGFFEFGRYGITFAKVVTGLSVVLGSTGIFTSLFGIGRTIIPIDFIESLALTAVGAGTFFIFKLFEKYSGLSVLRRFKLF